MTAFLEKYLSSLDFQDMYRMDAIKGYMEDVSDCLTL